MRVSKKTVSAVFTGAATAVAVTGLAPGQARAATSWHVKNSGIPYSGHFKATITGGLTDMARNLKLCSKAVASGTIPPPPRSAEIAVISHLSFSGCTALGETFKVHATKNIPVIGTGYASLGGVTRGELGGTAGAINISAKGVNNTCAATFSGASVPFSFMNTTHGGGIDPGKTATLKVTRVVNCPFAAGDTAAFTGTYKVVSPKALTIALS